MNGAKGARIRGASEIGNMRGPVFRGAARAVGLSWHRPGGIEVYL